MSFQHGASAYTNHGCRCAVCRAGNTERQRLRRRRLGFGPRVIRGRRHGFRSTYVNGCRCLECREAEALYRRDYRERKRAS